MPRQLTAHGQALIATWHYQRQLPARPATPLQCLDLRRPASITAISPAPVQLLSRRHVTATGKNTGIAYQNRPITCAKPVTATPEAGIPVVQVFDHAGSHRHLLPPATTAAHRSRASTTSAHGDQRQLAVRPATPLHRLDTGDQLRSRRGATATAASCHNGTSSPPVKTPGSHIKTEPITCEDCHNTRGWIAGVQVFDHSGRHRQLLLVATTAPPPPASTPSHMADHRN